jgi:integrase
MLVGDAWEIYRRECSDDILFWNRQRLAHEHLKALDGIAIESLKPSVIREALKGLSKYSSSTLRRDLQALNAAINTCRKLGLITHQPYIPMPKESAPRKQFATWEQMRMILNGADHYEPWMKTMAMLLCYTGQRMGIILRLTWGEIDLQNQTIWYSAKRKDRQKGALDVSMNAELYAYLWNLRQQLGHPHDSRLVVSDEYGRRPGSPNYWWRKLLNSVGLDKSFSPHIMRHSVATNLVRDGVPLIKVSKLLGHSSTAITERVYAKFSPGFTKETVNAIRINGGCDRPRS